MTLVTDILDRAARQCSIRPPSSWVSAQDQAILELRDFLDETVEDVQDRIEVTAPLAGAVTITGTGDAVYDLPVTFKRLKRGDFAVYERDGTRRACMPVTRAGEWEFLLDTGSAAGYRFYRVTGYDGAHQIEFFQPLSAGQAVVVQYVSTAWIAGDKSMFTAAEDVSLIPRRVLEPGIVFRFRERKGLDFASKNAEYEANMARYANDARAVRTIDFGQPAMRNPWDVPVPDVIPSS